MKNIQITILGSVPDDAKETDIECFVSDGVAWGNEHQDTLSHLHVDDITVAIFEDE